MFLYLGVSGYPLCLYAPICSYDPIHLYAPRGVHTTHVSPYSSVHLYVFRGFCMLWGVVRGPIHVGHFPYTSPCMGVPPSIYTPTHLLASLCIGMFWGYLYVIWGFLPYVDGLGVLPHLLGFWGASAHGMSICSFLYIL